MTASTSLPALLRRIARLEATVGRLRDELDGLRSAACRQGIEPPAGPARRATAAASARGEAARVRWVRDGLVVPGEQLAQAWGLTRQALAPAAARGEVFAVKVGNRLFYPRAFMDLDRAAVAAVCRALGTLGADDKLAFWLREHRGLAGRSVAQALGQGTAVAKVERLAAAWARESAGAAV